MADLIIISGPRKSNERSAPSFTARFRGSGADVTPTNVYWRLDTEDGCQLVDWTSVDPDTEVSIAVSGEQNRIVNCLRPIEAKVLTVMADRGLSTQLAGFYRFETRNLPWQE